MNKIKMFFVAAALLLVTAGVFAGKVKFTDPTNLYAYNSTAGVAYEITSSPFSGAFTTTQSGTQAQILNSASTAPYLLYQISGGTYTPVYTLSF